jgi:hypothetical protein
VVCVNVLNSSRMNHRYVGTPWKTNVDKPTRLQSKSKSWVIPSWLMVVGQAHLVLLISRSISMLNRAVGISPVS